MINEYIEKNKLMSHLFNKQDEDIDVMFEIANFNAEDVVSVSTYNQIRWERDIAMQQLEDYGIPFCSNIDTRVRNKLYNLECKNYAETNFECAAEARERYNKLQGVDSFFQSLGKKKAAASDANTDSDSAGK